MPPACLAGTDMDPLRRSDGNRMLRAAFVLVLGVLASGCVGSSPPPPPAPAEYPYAISLVNGTGYEYTVLLPNTTAVVSADFAAGRSAFAACKGAVYSHAW